MLLRPFCSQSLTTLTFCFSIEVPQPEEVEVQLDLTPLEENIRNNILEGEPLTKETLDEVLVEWWKREPYR